jgi:hypothetical protein
MPRSGTTLVEQILASHPAVFGAGELKEIGLAIQKLQQLTSSDTQFPDYLAHANIEMMNQTADEYLNFLSSISDGKYNIITNKMPQNFWYLGLIHKLFPLSKIIHCKRNPLDTCISCYFADFADGNKFSFDLENLGTYYTQYQKIMKHWRDTIGVPMLEIQYEDLVKNPEALSRELVGYCGLEWDDKCLSPHKTKRDVLTASTLQVRQRIYTSSIDRWKHYDRHIGPLREMLGDPAIGRADAVCARNILLIKILSTLYKRNCRTFTRTYNSKGHAHGKHYTPQRSGRKFQRPDRNRGQWLLELQIPTDRFADARCSHL